MNNKLVISLLNELKRRRKLRDYAIFGAIAATYYMEPIYTSYIDVLNLASNDQEYITVWNELKKHAQKIKGFGFEIHETEVQLFSTAGYPLFEDALKTAKKVKVGGVITKIVDKEHLIMLFL